MSILLAYKVHKVKNVVRLLFTEQSEPTTLKMSSSHVNLVMSNCDKFHQNMSTHSRAR